MNLETAALRHSAPPARTLEWACAAIGAGARVTSVRRLRGGTSSAMHALTIEGRNGGRHRLVLRRFVLADWLVEEPDLAAHEAAALGALTGNGIPAPDLVAFDVAGTATDVPAVLMTRLPGRIDLAPPDLDAHVRAIAALLPRIHAVCTGLEALPAYVRYFPQPEVPAGVADLELWRALIEYASRPPPPSTPTFIHRDFHPGNVLVARGRVSGVVDWVNACIGDRSVDVGHMRWNLALLHGIEAADAFLDAWRAEAGVAGAHDPYWDAVCLLDAGDLEDALEGWRDAGRRDLTLGVLHARREVYAASLVRRL